MPSISYRERKAAWFAERSLKRHAGVFHLWALGVGAVISGDFFGWNFGLAAGGFGGFLTAVVLMTILYTGLCFSVAEMSAALPHTGGAYSFARASMGPWGGYVTGLAENLEYILTPATIVVGIGGYLGAIFGTAPAYEPVWWLMCYIVFVVLNIWGVEMSFRVSMITTVCALAVLAVFYAGAIPLLDLRRWALADETFFARGARGVFASLPFALWLYLGIEQLPLAAEETREPSRDMPRGILWSLVTLVICSLLTSILSAGIAPGVAEVGRSSEPLFLGFQSIFGSGLGSRALALFAVTGLIASFHAILYAYGRQIYSLARAGYFPEWLSVTHGKRHTPHRALIAGSVLGFSAAIAIRVSGPSGSVGATLLNMAVFGAVLAYILQMASYILLRKKAPGLARPYVSPLGIPGAVIAALLAGITLMALFLNPDYRIGVAG
ncbi:MAG TPA: amino acid permease, partial [Bryobacteraceae bacterium]|nr:amino acid permease [Bryobacteraceae bacterium]